MKTSLKKRLSNISIWIMLISIALAAIWFFTFTILSTFGLRVFSTYTNSFFYIFIVTVIALNLLLTVFSISLNISIIADSRFSDEEKMPSSQKRNILLIVLVILVSITVILISGNLVTINVEKKQLITEAKGIMKRYDNTIEKISINLKDNSTINKVSGYIRFLESQKADYPEIDLIRQMEYNNEMSYVYIDQSTTNNDNDINFDLAYYKADDKELNYFDKVFSGKRNDILFIDDGDNSYVYIPVNRNGKIFIIKFIKQNQSHGYIGS